MMHPSIQRFAFVQEWYATHVRPLLRELEPARAKDYDSQIAALKAAEQRLEETASLCVLGRSGVGKSTLINALVGGVEMIVPNGGIGPLTAHALRVQHGKERSLEVHYHGKRELWKMTFGLQQAFRSELGIADSALTPPSDLEPDDDKVELQEPSAVSAPHLPEDDAARDEARREKRRLAALIVCGDQNSSADVRYLVAGLRTALSMKVPFEVKIDQEDTTRIAAVRRALELSKQKKSLSLLEASNADAFRAALMNHAAGHLAPLVSEMIVRVPNPILENGLEIVDLPGVGMASDVYRKKTRDWIRQKAQAVLLVIDHRGLDEPVLEMLRQTEFLNRLLYSRDDPEGRPELLVAVSQVDTIAQTDYTNEVAVPKRRKSEYFASACERSRKLVRHQLKDQLERASRSNTSSETDSQSLQASDALSILGEIEPFPLSAVEYRKLLARDIDDASFLRTEDETNVPALSIAIRDFAARFQKHRVENFARAVEHIFGRAMATLTLLHQQWAAERRDHAEMDRLRGDLKVFLEPLVAEFNRRQGRFTGFIRNEVPNRIELLVETATREASQEIETYLRNHVQLTHWATLRAAVRKGGTYYGTSRNVDLPREFALRYEEPIASTWGNKLLNPIRQTTKEYAEDCIMLVERIATWAGKQGTRVRPDLVEAQAASIREDAKHLTTVGATAVKKLRDEVKARLIDCIEQPIRAKCEQFVDEGRHLGSGTKGRILSLFRQIAREIAEAAKPASKQILLELYEEVLLDIQETLASHANPIEEASDSIVESQENFLKRSDAQRKRRILASIDAALAHAGVNPQSFDRVPLRLPGAVQ